MTTPVKQPKGTATQKDKKAISDWSQTVAIRLRTKYGIYGDLPKALPLDKNIAIGEEKRKLGSGKIS